MKPALWFKYAVYCQIIISSILFSYADERILFGTEDYAPYNYIDEKSGQLTGFSYDVVQTLILLVGDQNIAEIKVFPWARIYNMAQNMENVAIFSMIHSQQRDNLFKWVGTLYYADSFIWKLATREDINIAHRKDLMRYQTAVLNGGIDQQILIKHYNLSIKQHLRSVSSANQKLFTLFNGHVDLAEYAEMPLRWKMRKMSLDFDLVEKVLAIPEMAPLSLAFSPQTSDEIVERYRLALIAIKENGVYDQLLEKWRLPESHQVPFQPNNSAKPLQTR